MLLDIFCTQGFPIHSDQRNSESLSVIVVQKGFSGYFGLLEAGMLLCAIFT
jgi:hypothetical protein